MSETYMITNAANWGHQIAINRWVAVALLCVLALDWIQARRWKRLRARLDAIEKRLAP